MFFTKAPYGWYMQKIRSVWYDGFETRNGK